MAITTNTKALVVDASGLYPISFSLAHESVTLADVINFFNVSGVDLYYGAYTAHEFTMSFNAQPSLFVATPSIEINDNNPVYLSHAGEVSISSFGGVELPINNTLFKDKIVKQPTIWESSKHYKNLSYEDKQIINSARGLNKVYDKVAVLSNDWSLRRQAKDYESVRVHGTCSLLAGLVLREIITPQKATHIYNSWKKENHKWIPKAEHNKQPWAFKQILDKEKERKVNNASFWL